MIKTLPTMVRKDTELSAEPVDDQASRRLKFTISTETVDGDGDKIAATAWDLSAIKKNGIVLFGHDQKSLPIAKIVEIGVEGKALKATIEFVPEDVPEIGPRAEAIFRLLKQGFLSAASVGFQPTAYELSDRMVKGRPGLNIHAATLYELSIVNIGSNGDAMIEARSLTEEILRQKQMIVANIKARRVRRMNSIAI